MTLTACRFSGADDPNPILAPIGVRYEQDPLPCGRSDREEATFFDGVVRIIERERERILEHGRGFVERHAMLAKISRGPVRVPFVNHGGPLDAPNATVALSSVRSLIARTELYPATVAQTSTTGPNFDERNSITSA
jgi:hypothetical protein